MIRAVDIVSNPPLKPDPEAEFEATFLQHYARIYGVVYCLVGDRAEAEDLTLETFWKFWERPPANRDNVIGWLCRVATHLGYNTLRAAKRRAKYETDAGREALDINISPDPARQAESNIEQARVREALRRMNARNAQLLILRHSGFAYKEIAAALDVAPTSIGTLLARAEEEFERLYDSSD